MGNDLYRARLNEPLNEKVLKFISSIEDDLWIAEEDIIGTETHNIMLYEQKMLTKTEIKQILISLENIKKKLFNNELELDKNFEDIHPFVENCVINDIGIEVGGKIHTGRSRNDQVSVDVRLKIRAELNVLSEKLLDLCDVLLEKSIKHISVFVPLYTHLQRAQLGVFSHYLNNYISQILRSLKRIEEIYLRNNFNPLGACAIGGTSININRKRTTELLGFNGILENSIDAISSRDYIYETLALLSLISIEFSRIAEDLIIWASKEFDFVELDEQFCSVSSVMPQKKNPDTLELVRGKCSKIISNLFSASLIIKSLPSGYFRDFQELKMLIKNSFESTFSIIEMLNGIFSSLSLNEKKMRAIVEKSDILALDLAELIVNEYKVPFRQSHKIVANLVKNSIKTQDFLNKENIEKEIFNETHKKIIISQDFVESLKNLNLCLDKRISQGSPSKLEVEKLIKSLIEVKTELYNNYLSRVKAIENAANLREELIKELIK